MTVACVALLSGGLDSMLAIRIMQEQGIQVEALNFQTQFTCCQDTAGQAARELGVRLTVLSAADDYLDVVRQPEFGYGRGANPCVDCRIYMFQRAAQFMRQQGCQFVVSGEVLGQRPNSQKRKDLEIIAHHSGLQDLLLRPLSAHLMAPTLPEREGWVDRRRLYRLYGRGRKPLIALAKQFGLQSIPHPSTGCALTEQLFSRKVHDLITLDPHSNRWDFELLKIGRHYRLDRTRKVIVGRHAEDNAKLQFMQRTEHTAESTLIEPDNFTGPATLLVGLADDGMMARSVALLLRHARHYDPATARVRVTRMGNLPDAWHVATATVEQLGALDHMPSMQQLPPITAEHRPKPVGDPTP